jgi:hypothetical protein
MNEHGFSFSPVDTCCKCHGVATQSEWLGACYGSSCSRLDPICAPCFKQFKKELIEKIDAYLDKYSRDVGRKKCYWLSFLLTELDKLETRQDFSMDPTEMDALESELVSEGMFGPHVNSDSK